MESDLNPKKQLKVEVVLADDVNKPIYDEAEQQQQQPLSPAARIFHSPGFNCHIIAKIGCTTTINPCIIKEGLKQTLIKHPRFSSKLVWNNNHKGEKKRWVRTSVNVDEHVVVPKVDIKMGNSSAEAFIEEYISHMTSIPMDLTKPLWEIHILNVKTSDANALGVFKIHHSMGDGASLMSLLLACTRKSSDPESLPTLPTQKIKDSKASNGYFWSVFLFIWLALTYFFNTLVDLVLFTATVLFLRDTDTPIKGAIGVERKPKRYVHRTVSLDDIKLVKNAGVNVTINDVMLGVTEAGLSRYLNRSYSANEKLKFPKNIRLRSTILVNVRPMTGIQALADMMSKEGRAGWGNMIGYIVFPFKICLRDDPLDYIRMAKRTIDRKKQSLEAMCTYLAAKLITKLFGAKATAATAHRALTNTTIAFSNLVGPLEEISFFGHPVAYIAPSVYGHPHALTIHYQSYINKMTISLAVDPDSIPHPHRLCDDLEESLKIIKTRCCTV